MASALTLHLAPASAQPKPAEPPPASPTPPARPADDTTTAAQDLFRQASEKLDQRDFDAACPMLEEVLRMEPAANGARLALAECHEGSGRLASAYKTYTIVAENAAHLGQIERQKLADARARALLPQLGAVIVQVAPPVRALAGVAITTCGQPLADADQGKPRPADRGPCTVTATAPGKVRWERTVEVTDGATASVTIDQLEDAPGAASTTPIERRPLIVPPGPTSPPPVPSPLSHRGQFGAFVRLDIDVLSEGAVTVIGATYGASDHIELSLAGLVGKRGGFEVGASGYLLTGAVKPYINVGAPVLFEDRAYAGMRGALGVQWDFHRHVGAFATVGAAYFPEVPKGYTHAVVLPALGVQGRL